MRSVLRRLLATAVVAGVATTGLAASSSTSVVAVPAAAVTVPVHGGSGLDGVCEPRPELAGFHRSLMLIRRTDEEQPGAER